MARVASGGWLSRALALADATDGMSPAQRRRFLDDERRAGRGGAVQTMHRHVRAAKWLVQRAKAYDVPLDAVKVAWTGVEAMARLENVRPEHAARFIKDGLLGRMTSRQLIMMAGMAPSARRRPNWPNAWEAFLIDELVHLLGHEPGTITSVVADMSELGKMIQVDVEWKTDRGAKYAVFLSSEIIYSQHDSFISSFKAVTAARAFYDKVVFFTDDEEEKSFFRKWEPDKSKGLAPLIVS